MSSKCTRSWKQRWRSWKMQTSSRSQCALARQVINVYFSLRSNWTSAPCGAELCGTETQVKIIFSYPDLGIFILLFFLNLSHSHLYPDLDQAKLTLLKQITLSLKLYLTDRWTDSKILWGFELHHPMPLCCHRKVLKLILRTLRWSFSNVASIFLLVKYSPSNSPLGSWSLHRRPPTVAFPATVSSETTTLLWTNDLQSCKRIPGCCPHTHT